jgi:hypothetical protein
VINPGEVSSREGAGIYTGIVSHKKQQGLTLLYSAAGERVVHNAGVFKSREGVGTYTGVFRSREGAGANTG